MDHHIRTIAHRRAHFIGFPRVWFISKWRTFCRPLQTEPSKRRQCRFHAVEIRLQRWHESVVQRMILILLGTNSVSPCQTRIRKTRRASMKIDDGPEPSCKQTDCGTFPSQRNHFGEIRIAVEARGKTRFHDHGNSKVWKLFFECSD